MDAGKEQIFQDKRQERAKEVRIQFIDPQNFNVLDDDGNVKYIGKIIQKDPHKDDYCTCPSFFHNNNDDYFATHGVAYSCKHIIKSRQVRYGEASQEVV